MTIIIQEQLASQVIRSLSIHAEASVRLEAVERIEDPEARRKAISPLAADFKLCAYALGNMLQLAREMQIDSLPDKTSLLSAGSQMACSLNSAGETAAQLARSDHPVQVRPPSGLIMNQVQLDQLFDDQTRAWLLNNATKETRRDLKALRASLSLSEF